MNHKFAELAKELAQSVTRRQPRKLSGLAIGLTSMALCLPASADSLTLGPLIELSQPNAVGTCDDGVRLPGGFAGTMTLNDAAEPFVAVNPTNPKNLVAAWIGGLFQNVLLAVSFDGGATWQQVPLPMTLCSGGPYLAAGDPWLSFAPNGDLYASTVTGFAFSATIPAVQKSTDGGLSWSAPVALDSPANAADKPTIFADLSDSRFVYAVWVDRVVKNRDWLAFARTTDGGVTWEPARALLSTEPGIAAYDAQFQMAPDGTLHVIYQIYVEQQNKPPTLATIQVLSSTDKGQTWSAPTNALVTTPVFQSNSSGWLQVADPETGALVRDPFNPTVVVDRRSGNLYSVWEDGRFSNFQYNDIAFSMSGDGGLTWSTPIRVNQTPLTIPTLNRQAFLPTIAVGVDGNIAVTYYDFRFNDANPGVPTDYWLVQCQPTPSRSPTNPANWGNELRLTPNSFNLEAVATSAGFFLGDYFGLAPMEDGGFVSMFGAVDQNNHTAIFTRRIEP